MYVSLFSYCAHTRCMACWCIMSSDCITITHPPSTINHIFCWMQLFQQLLHPTHHLHPIPFNCTRLALNNKYYYIIYIYVRDICYESNG